MATALTTLPNPSAFKTPADPCFGCGPGHPSNGNPSCNTYQPCKDIGGCAALCQTSNPSYYLDGKCVPCPPGHVTLAQSTPGLTQEQLQQEACGDLLAFMNMDLTEKTQGLSKALCKVG